MNLLKNEFDQLETKEQFRVMYEAGYQTGYEDCLTKDGELQYDTTPFLTAKKSKPTLLSKVVKYTFYSWPVLLIIGCYTLAFWRDALDAKAKHNRIHSALAALYVMRTDGLPIQESQDDPVPLLEE